MRHSLYSIKLSHDDIYQDNNIVPPHCIGYIITTTIVRITYCDEPSLNTLSTAHLLTIINDMRVHKIIPTPLRQSQRLLPDTLTFEQCDINTLITLYNPLLQSLARRAHATTARFFTYDDLLQEAYLVLATLYRKGYYIHGNMLQRAFVNHIRVLLRKEPTHYAMIPLSTPQDAAHAHSDERDVTLDEQLIDEKVAEQFDNLLLDDARAQRIAEQRDYVLTVISQRTYDQLIREYRTNTTSTSNGKLINDIRRMLGINKRSK